MSTDDAWRALTLQIDLVRHAETKAGAALASAGVLGGLLYTLVSQTRSGGLPFAVLAAATAIAVHPGRRSGRHAVRARRPGARERRRRRPQVSGGQHLAVGADDRPRAAGHDRRGRPDRPMRNGRTA
ncbi:hypothetical protein ACIA5D_44060 [Actinoplanes sp. NPDC051513]|uniref:hypothetical protein n=1 Tax=Actinoplanes sp. NPDC051513 TaxID=3363908 RepID=UPI003795BA8A